MLILGVNGVIDRFTINTLLTAYLYSNNHNHVLYY